MPADISRIEADLLLVEDDPDDCFMITRALRRIDPQLRIVTLRDGVELTEYLQARHAVPPPRLVILDLNMPRMDGREVLAWAQHHEHEAIRGIAFVVLSTSVEAQDRLRSQSLNAAGFISKPDQFGELVEALREVLAVHLRPSLPETAPCPAP